VEEEATVAAADAVVMAVADMEVAIRFLFESLKIQGSFHNGSQVKLAGHHYLHSRV
jgi:hypothetical protein